MREWLQRAMGVFPFYGRCLVWAVSGAWGAIGVITTILPLVVAFLADSPTAAAYIPFADAMTEGSAWKWPMAFGLLALFVRLFFAPYRQFREEREETDRLQEITRPKLSIECDKTVSGCVVESKFNSGDMVNFFRIKVVSDSMKPVPKCTGFLVRVSKAGTVLLGHESVQLTFAPGNESDALSKTLHPRVPAFLDVLALLENRGILLCTKNFTRYYSIGDLFPSHGTYILRVAISGKGMRAVAASLKFDWTGDWKTSDLSLMGVES